MDDPRAVPQITVAICTHNRFDDLRSALDGLTRQTLPLEAYEVLIVDNSTDHTARDAFRATCTIPSNARWLDSSPPGLSRARNLALETASTELVAFIDDDAIPAPEWAEELLHTFRAHPNYAVVAGPIDLDWQGMARPAWFPPKHESCLSTLDLGSEDRVLGPSEYGYGANLAIRRDLARAVGGFSETLGRRGGAILLSNEDFAIQDRLRAAGHTARYAARARVRHRIRAEMVTRNWLRARMAWQAVSESMRDGGCPWLDWSRQELRRAATALGIEKVLGALLGACDREAFGDQLDLILHMYVILLAEGKEPEGQLESLFPPPLEPANIALVLAQEKRNSYELRITQAEAKAEEANARASEAEAKADEANARAVGAEAKVDNAVAQAAAANMRLEAVLHSTSWRIMGPMRRLLEPFPKLRTGMRMAWAPIWRVARSAVPPSARLPHTHE